MANQALASGSVVLTANADQMTRGLAEAENKAVQSFHKTESKLNKAAQKFMKHEGGFLGTVGGGLLSDLGVGGAAAGIVGGVLALQQVAKLTREIAGYSNDFDRALEKSKELSTEIAKVMDRVNAKQMEFVNASTDAGEKQYKLAEEIKRTETELAGVVKRAEGAEAVLKKLDLTFAPGKSNVGEWLSGGIGLTGGLEELRKGPKASMEEAAASAAKLREHLSGARIALREMTDPESASKLSSFNRALEKLRDEYADLEAAPADKFMRPFERMGMAEDRLKMLRDTFTQLEARKEEFANRPVSTNLPVWMSSMIGLTSEVGKELHYMAVWGPKAMEPLKLAGAVEAGSASGYSLSVNNQFAGASQNADRVVKAIQDGTKRITDVLGGLGIVI